METAGLSDLPKGVRTQDGVELSNEHVNVAGMLMGVKHCPRCHCSQAQPTVTRFITDTVALL